MSSLTHHVRLMYTDKGRKMCGWQKHFNTTPILLRGILTIAENKQKKFQMCHVNFCKHYLNVQKAVVNFCKPYLNIQMAVVNFYKPILNVQTAIVNFCKQPLNVQMPVVNFCKSILKVHMDIVNIYNAVFNDFITD